MSVEAMAWVLNHSPTSGTEKIILLGVANHDGDGGSWPSVNTLARYANVSRRNVQKALASLVAGGHLTIRQNQGGTADTPAHKRPNRYIIRGVSTGVSSATPRGVSTGVSSATDRGVASDAKGVSHPTPETSLNHPRTKPVQQRWNKQVGPTPTPPRLSEVMAQQAALCAT